MKTKKSAIIDCLRTLVRKQPIVTLYFEFETVLKFFNLEARFSPPGGGGGGVVLWYFHTYVGSGHFFGGFKFSWGFQKNKYFLGV